MTITLSKYAIESMGFTEFPETDVIHVQFGIIKVYSIRGIVFKQNCADKRSEVISLSENCSVAIAQSVNEASKLLNGDVFFDDEQKWISEKKATPPFLLIYFTESIFRELRGGYRMIESDVIQTYDAFPDGKLEIRNWEADNLPGIITSLTVKLSKLDRQIELVPLESSIFGTTNEGTRLFDVKITGSAKGYVSISRSLEEINTSLKNTRELLPILTKELCRNFYAALNEPDRMKQFLGYFQFIERYTHSTFKSLNYDTDAKEVFNVPERIKEPISLFFESIFSDAKNLSQRFHWCAIIAWQNIEENDVNYFLEAKKVRDKLSHGEHVEDTELPVEKTKTLALKLLGSE